ncbi:MULTISPECIES: VWA domain-containing protein [Emticicia]|uniref:vWA domain-containing protein n=1 Tax=Emticicia TaxID=312278 RepID=UPI0007D8ABE4|nr:MULTISPECIES: VWA domain-containing protein [Emticicia]
MKTKIWVLIALVFGIFAFTTQRTIKGKVLSASDGSALSGVMVAVKGTSIGTQTDVNGDFQLTMPAGSEKLIFSYIGYKSQEIKVGQDSIITVKLEDDTQALQEVVVVGYSTQQRREVTGAVSVLSKNKIIPSAMLQGRVAGVQVQQSGTYRERKKRYSADKPKEDFNTEEYNSLVENIFQETKSNPLTTFSIDVDRAGYSNVRRMLNAGMMPAKDAIRIEEMVNYFDYDYPQPTTNEPVTINSELSDSPWNKGLKLLKIGIQAQKISTENLPASNLVFLIDVSGSMATPERLPLVKQALYLLTDQLRLQDKVSIVVYAGAAGLVLSPTSDKNKIKNALENLQAGGSTAGGEGIKLAYKIAAENLIKGGNNRVILASDGDFNVGVSSEAELKALIEEKRNSGVFLSILGFGMGNYKDNKMETLADKGNGNYAYIDNLQEAQKVFVHEFGGTMFTVAKDVKLQLEFNPAFVKAYRLIGYENRMLHNEDFNDDKKDAGEMGSGHTVTALYEIVPVGIESAYLKNIDQLKYQTENGLSVAAKSNEVLTVKLRYKSPDENKSRLMEKVITDQQKSFDKTSENFRFAVAVAEFGLILRQSEFKGMANYEQVIDLAKNAKGSDDEGYRAEFIKLVKTAKMLDKTVVASNKD